MPIETLGGRKKIERGKSKLNAQGYEKIKKGNERKQKELRGTKRIQGSDAN